MLRNIVVKHKLKMIQTTRRNASNLIFSQGFIDGCWVDSSSAETFPVLNPADGSEVGCVSDMTAEDAQRAICAAKEAFYRPDWHELTASKRSALLMKWFALIEKNRNEIAKIMTSECGKPIKEAQGEIAFGNGFIEWFAAEARRTYGETIPTPAMNRNLLSLKQPVGVAAMITPWNFPFAMITRKASAALAAGCTVVIKPAEATPLTALALAKLAEDAGVPKGILNVLPTQNAAAVGELFCNSPDVAVISFTGSTTVGKLLYQLSASTMKRLSLELGGNAPFIVFESANITRAVQGAMQSKFLNCGQACIASNRFFIQEKIFDKFLSQLKAKVSSLKIGHGDKEGVQIGPLINHSQLEKVKKYVEDAVQKGATVIQGGKPCPDIGNLFYAPTILTNVCPDMELYQNEIFGPVVSMMKFKTEEEVIELANGTRTGLGGYFYSEDIQQIYRVARKLEVGAVGINDIVIALPEGPFGGVKESGFGREGSHYGIDEYLDVKYLCLGNMKP